MSTEPKVETKISSPPPTAAAAAAVEKQKSGQTEFFFLSKVGSEFSCETEKMAKDFFHKLLKVFL